MFLCAEDETQVTCCRAGVYLYAHDGQCWCLNTFENEIKDSEVCHPRCVFKLKGAVNFSQNTTINMAK